MKDASEEVEKKENTIQSAQKVPAPASEEVYSAGSKGIITPNLTESEIEEFQTAYAAATGEQTLPLRCRICSATYSSKKAMKKHIKDAKDKFHINALAAATRSFAEEVEKADYSSIGKRSDAFMSLCDRPNDEQLEDLRKRSRKAENKVFIFMNRWDRGTVPQSYYRRIN